MMKYSLFVLIVTVLTVGGFYIDGFDDDSTEPLPSHPYGRPIKILRFERFDNITIDHESLNATFMHPEVKDRKIVAISIAGGYRKGKSFLMNYALRYMYANYKSVANPDNPLSNKQDWVGDENEPLKGFVWRHGINRYTNGIALWSDVFLHDFIDAQTKKVEKIAIILLDTRELMSRSQNDLEIFLLCSLISSIQIFNMYDVIQENQLENLLTAAEFSKFATTTNEQQSKPFQNQIFLMRDWQNDGLIYLQKVRTANPYILKSLLEVKNRISETFEKIICFLLPHPGANVTINPEYDGRFSELDEKFQTQMKDFIKLILEPENLKTKKILDYEVTGVQYLEYLTKYFEEFQSENIPKMQTLYELTVKTHYDIIISEAMTKYKNSFQHWTLQNTDNNVLLKEIDDVSKNIFEAASEKFRSSKHPGSSLDVTEYENELMKQIQLCYQEWIIVQMNASGVKILEEKEDLKNETEEIERIMNLSQYIFSAMHNDYKLYAKNADNQSQSLFLQLENDQKKIFEEYEKIQQLVQKEHNLTIQNIKANKEEHLKDLKRQIEYLEAELQNKIFENDREKALAEQRQFDHDQEQYDYIYKLANQEYINANQQLESNLLFVEREHKRRLEDIKRQLARLFLQPRIVTAESSTTSN